MTLQIYVMLPKKKLLVNLLVAVQWFVGFRDHFLGIDHGAQFTKLVKLQ